MAKKKLAQAAPFQLLSEKIMGITAVLLVFFHMFLSFSRHFFSPQNRIYSSPVTETMLNIDKWLGLLLFIYFVFYLVISKLYYFETWYRIRDVFKKLFCKEWIVLFAVFLYYLFVCVVQSTKYTNIFKSNDLWLFDFMISCILLLPMASIVGYKNMKKIMDIILHVIMILSTGFILWALWNLFQLNLVTLPNSLQVGMTDGYRFFPGVNENIGAGIGMTMVMIALYMAVTHRGIIRIVYSICVIPHLYATLLTGSRGHFVALFISLPLLLFMIVWNGTAGRKKSRRILFSCLAAFLTAGMMCWLYEGVFTVFERITHLGEYMGMGSTPSVREITQQTGRENAWPAAVKMMFSSLDSFFFGTPVGMIPQKLTYTAWGIEEAWYAHAHNMILQVGLVAGVPAMIGFVVFWVMMAVRCIRVGIKKIEGFPGAYVLPVAVLAIVIANVFEPFLLFYFSVMACLFFLFCGWIVAIDRGIQ